MYRMYATLVLTCLCADLVQKGIYWTNSGCENAARLIIALTIYLVAEHVAFKNGEWAFSLHPIS